MADKSIQQIMAIEAINKRRFLKVNPKLNDDSGIYFLLREDENGIGYFYIGQAKHILTRLAQHMVGYQHIDISLKKRGFYSIDNPHGWKVHCLNYPENVLDIMEQHWILEYTKAGYQCRYNKTSGGQGTGKTKINEYKPSKGYREGVEQGRKQLAKELSHIIEKHLKIAIKEGKEHNKISQKAFEKFNDLLKVGD